MRRGSPTTRPGNIRRQSTRDAFVTTSSWPSSTPYRRKPWGASSSRNRAAWSRRRRCSPAPANSSRSGGGSFPPRRWRCGWGGGGRRRGADPPSPTRPGAHPPPRDKPPPAPARGKKRAREHIVAKLAGVLSPGVIKALDGLLEVNEGGAVSGLQGIKANPAKPSATAMQGLADKLAAIEATGTLAVDLSWLNANYQRALFHYVRKCSADRLRDAGRDRRLAALVCFLRQSYRDAVDQAGDMFDKLLTRTHTRAEHELDDQG